MTPEELLEAMGAQLRVADADWIRGEPAPVFDAYGTMPLPSATAVGERRDVEPAGPRIAAALAAARQRDAELNLFTSIHAEAAMADAAAVDATRAAGEPVGLLAGMPVAVKDLLDVRGVVTLAGSRLLATDPPAQRDATVTARLRAAGAAIVGSANMDELAYGFTTENTHYGPTRNPLDPTRVAGGSSGGSAAAVAAGVVDAAIGSDTNGSIRIPAAFCGVYGLRPTYGRVPLTGAIVFAASLDVLGPIARAPADLARVFRVVAGPDGLDPICRGGAATDLPEPAAARAACAGGALWDGAAHAALDAANRVASALGADDVVELPDVERARAAAIVMTAAEGADQHQAALRAEPELFDPQTRGRFLAGLTVPATDYLAAQRFRRHWQPRVLALFDDLDVLVLPTTPCPPPTLLGGVADIDGRSFPAGAVLGRFTQPISFAGLPALTVPVRDAATQPASLRWGVQLVGRPGSEALLIGLAALLEEQGVVGST